MFRNDIGASPRGCIAGFTGCRRTCAFPQFDLIFSAGCHAGELFCEGSTK
jgi:hypothetical protein